MTVQILAPRYDGREPETEAAMWCSVYRYGWPHPIEATPCNPIGRGRSILANLFMQTDCEWSLWIDGDMVFQPWQALELAQRAIDWDADIMSGTYQMRFDDGALVGSITESAPVGEAGRVVPALSCGFGFVVVRRRCYDMVKSLVPVVRFNRDDGTSGPHYFREVLRTDSDGTLDLLSEDVGFCELARSVGARVYMHTGIVIGHKGKKVFRP